ncbi:MAG: hypothetical protein AAF329_20315, partial [Cyanobacteria bacterium P01_A01_bin.17]
MQEVFDCQGDDDLAPRKKLSSLKIYVDFVKTWWHWLHLCCSLCASTILLFSDLTYTGSFLLFLLSCALINFFSLFFHEIGHALASQVLGFKTFKIFLGSGSTLLDRRMYGIRWVINSVPN